jgi:hypothetical protein
LVSGGIASLFTGASLLSAVELVFWVIKIIFHRMVDLNKAFGRKK